MRLLLRATGLAILLSGTLAADVLVLKDGRKVGGKVVDKPDRYEITTDQGLRSFLKEEVEKVVTSPKELLGESDKLFEEAKQEYQDALSIADPAQQSAKLKDALSKVQTVREALAAARDLFPDDKGSEIDQKLVQVMQLMRLLRERVGSDLATRRSTPRGPAMINGPASSASPGSPFAPAVVRTASPEALSVAFSALADPAKRTDAVVRAVARETFRTQRHHFPEAFDIATAGMIFLSRPEAEWRLQGAAAKALAEYFAKGWLKEPAKLTPAIHQQAAAWLIAQIDAVRKAEPGAAVDALALLGIGHYANAPFTADGEKRARALGLMVKNGIAGTPEGFVIRDLNPWIGNGDFDLAVLTWVKEYREIDTPAVRFVWAYALLRLAQAKKKGIERSVSAFETVRVSDAPTKDHIDALKKSIKAEASCSSCGGEGKYRCPNCVGKKEIRTNCVECKGTGKKAQPGRGFRLQADIPCYPCRGRGYTQLIVCEKCKDGTITCPQCGGKSPKPPELEEICSMSGCADCDGRGWMFRTVLWACRSCMGLGQKITPKADPTKVLP
ncbi:MAG TPA: hypothetical protein VJB14_05075 [Planctomycetota bacterium]|nr:hypothetical protein [Planctomycetota bacterium]